MKKTLVRRRASQTKASDPVEPFITTREAARVCRVSIFTVQRWFDKGFLKGAKLPGGRRRIDRPSFDAFLRKQGMTEAAAMVMHRVLIVEDDPKVLDALKDGFALHDGYSVRTATNCMQAGLAVAQFHPDSLVLDVLLEDKPGAELVREIRSAMGDQMRIIAISGRSGSHEEKEIMDAGADEYLKKPFKFEVLFKALAAPRRVKR